MVHSRAERERALEDAAAAIRVCTLCRLHATRTRAVPGEGRTGAAILFVGEAPGRDEDALGRPFVGRAGKILDAALVAAQLPREAVFITNLVKCRPPGNRRPKRDEWETCRPYLIAQIDLVRPRAIVTLGATALRGLMGTGLELRESRRKPLQFGRLPVFPTYHPAAVLYNRRLEPALRRDLARATRFAAGEVRSGKASSSGRKTSLGPAATR